MKHHTIISFVIFTVFFAFSTPSISQDHTTGVSKGLQHQSLESLAQDRQWLDLLHYHRIGLFSSFESQADDENFFLSVDGKSKPYAEIKATVSAFLKAQDSNMSAHCKFPARLHWLKSKLGDAYFPIHTCEEYDQWVKKIDARSITLIFPAAYLNSPSSMFGHTLLRINRLSGKNSLLDYSVNYAANADPDDNELVFTYKGLTGGYPGVFTVLPYYEKVNEYSFLESRDVWEYELTLNQDEVDQFIRHTWEIQNIHFDYYFFDENCSYQLLTILDAASSRLHLADQFKLSAAPADTVRAISDAELVSTVTFRPSTLSLLKGMLNQVNSDAPESAKVLAQPATHIAQNTQHLSETEKAKTLELAYQYSRYLSVRKKLQSKALNKQAVALLSARSKIDISNVYKPYSTPEFRDDEGHFSKRLATKFGSDKSNKSQNSQYTQLGLRMAYHDLFDPISGYIKGARLEMFNFEFRHNPNQNKTRIQNIRLIDIASLSARDELVTPISWHVSTGFKRPDSAKEELTAFLTSGAGVSYQWGNQLFYGLLNGELNLDNDIRNGYRIASGPRLGWLTQTKKWSAGIEANYLYDVFGAEFKEQNTDITLAYHFNKKWQARAEFNYKQYFIEDIHTTIHEYGNSISIMHYF
jgi:hypothetical protein